MNMIMFSLAILFVVFGVCEIVIGLGGWRALGAALRLLAEDKNIAHRSRGYWSGRGHGDVCIRSMATVDLRHCEICLARDFY